MKDLFNRIGFAAAIVSLVWLSTAQGSGTLVGGLDPCNSQINLMDSPTACGGCTRHRQVCNQGQGTHKKLCETHGGGEGCRVQSSNGCDPENNDKLATTACEENYNNGNPEN